MKKIINILQKEIGKRDDEIHRLKLLLFLNKKYLKYTDIIISKQLNKS
jgi:hypothetical protein